ncbi:MAG TPA: hypothetical protein VL400_03600 [Polyangiaceae bacterium]|jgi:hypothetical protein|nr:hypothetical protein [Polyangiaceae bacterium]
MDGDSSQDDDFGPASLGADEAIRAERFARESGGPPGDAALGAEARPALGDDLAEAVPPESAAVAHAREAGPAPAFDVAKPAPPASSGVSALVWLAIVLAVVVAAGIWLARR